LQLYNLETGKTLQLVDTLNEDLLNDMEGNISWSPDEAYLTVSNKLVFNSEGGKLLTEINAENVFWSASGDKLAYIKPDNGLGKSLLVLDIKTAAIEEVFIANNGEYLPGYMVWNENETKLAFVTAAANAGKVQEGISPYKAIYDLDLSSKKALRIDYALEMNQGQVERLISMHYNSQGNILAAAVGGYSDSDLYMINISTGEWKFYMNAEYLHNENNEDYVCSAGNSLYYVQGQKIIEIDESMNKRLIYTSADIIEDIYISSKVGSMIIIEKSKHGTVLRQLMNFTAKNM
jgi:hypothetical protein